ncbi:MAG: phage holin family protein [Planctomycetaceae bacterium]|jgi:hypothetical protein|nr:phage holin family protein [Planctomycetaceae bacterium]
MADQTQVNQNHKEPPSEPKGSLHGDFMEVFKDLLILAELQSQLFLVELQQVRKRFILPSICLIAGVMLGASCFPIALIAFALCVAHLGNLSIAASFVVTLTAGSLASMILLFVSSTLVLKQGHLFSRSQGEFVRNYRWLKSVFNRNRFAQRNSINRTKERK